MKIKSSYLFWVTLAAIALVWVGLRFYRLSENEIFFGDTARDYLAVWQLVREHKPVWLGPSNSATPLSQSAAYFYLLAPLLAVTNFAFYANQLTLLLFTWIIILVCAKLVYPHRRHWSTFFLLLILFLLQPTTLVQSRLVWNPSFAWQGLFLATWLIFTPPPTGKIKRWTPALVGLALAFANAMSFVVAPAVLVFALPYWWSRERWLDLKKYALGFISGSLVLFLPMLAFEVRYQFQITRRFLGALGGDMVRINSLGERMSLATKLQDTATIFFGNHWLLYLLLTLLLILAVGQWRRLQKKAPPSLSLFHFLLLGFLITFGLSMVFPVPIHSHYIVGMSFFLLGSLASAPGKSKLLVTAVVALVFIRSLITGNYFAISHLYAQSQLESCARQVCTKLTPQTPVYVSTVSSLYPSHAGHEWQFALKKAGCMVPDINLQPELAQDMIVFGTGTAFSASESAYHERTLFGDAQVIEAGVCQQQMEWTWLKKI